MAVYPLTDEFGEAQKNVNLGQRRLVAQAAHLEVRAVLKFRSELREHGLDDVLIGSYARDTGIWPGKDVDVFGKLGRESVESIRPDVAYQLFLSALEPHYAGRLTKQPRSIKIDFGLTDERTPADEFLRELQASRDDVFPFSVDVVPAVRSGDIWAIPSHDRGEWQRTAAAERWVRTDPEKLTDLTTERNKEPSIGGQGVFVPTVKAMRQIRRAHLGDAKPGGLYIELVLHEGFADGEIIGESWADVTASALAFIARRLRLAVTQPVCDPVLLQPYAPAPTADQLAAAAGTFEVLASRGQEALSQEKCPAAATWRGVFGSNSKGAVFPLPSGCVADRSIMVPAPSASPLRSSNEARGFGGA